MIILYGLLAAASVFSFCVGKKIFEGDIVRFPPERNCVVEWDDGCYWVVPAKPDHPDPLTGSDLQYASVIGNIFDNPELMKELK